MPLESVVLMGDPGPTSIGGTISDIGIGRPGLNNSNTIGLKLNFSGGSVSVAVVTMTLGGSAVPCVLGGAAAPGTSGTFSDFDPPAINQNNELSIESDVSGDPNVSKGIFTCAGGAVHAIALEGDHKPGTTSTFGDDLSDASLSDDGRVAFIDPQSPTGVFVSFTPASPAPALNHAMLVGLLSLLVAAGVVLIRSRTFPRTGFTD